MPPDLTFSGSIPNDGGISLHDDFGNVIDQVGMDVGSVFFEGTPLAPLAGDVDQSYERKLGGCQDDNDNSVDFQLIAPSNPQDTTSPYTVCALSCTTTTTTTSCPGSYLTNFNSPLYNGDAGGSFDLNGQDGWYEPIVSALDHKVYTYVGNVLSVPAHPFGGGDQFGAGLSNGVNVGRSQHDVDFSIGGRWIASFDSCLNFIGVPPTLADQAIAFFSTQPSATAKSFTSVCRWNDTTPTDYEYIVNVFSSANADLGFLSPGLDWASLVPNRWYRHIVEWDFTTNLISQITLIDLLLDITTVVNPVGWYLRGGAFNPTFPLPTSIRFSTSSPAGANNVFAFDNTSIECALTLTTTTVAPTTTTTWCVLSQVCLSQTLDPPTDIPDDDVNGVTLSQVTTEDGLVISIELVMQNFTHDFAGDLICKLRHLETGTTVDVFNRLRLGGEDSRFGAGETYKFVDVSTDHIWVAASLVGPGVDIPGDDYFPTTASGVRVNFSDFNGELVAGTWQLIISDNGPGDTGSIGFWRLCIDRDCNPEATTTTTGAPTTTTTTTTASPPAIFFYGGDTDGLDQFDNYVASFANSRVYDDFTVPAGGRTITVIEANHDSTPSIPTIVLALVEIRTGVSAGNGGTVVYTASHSATTVATGPTTFRLNIAGLSIPLAAGTYHLVAAPDLNVAGPSFATYLMSTGGVNSIGSPISNDNAFVDSPTFSWDFEPVVNVTGFASDFSYRVTGF